MRRLLIWLALLCTSGAAQSQEALLTVRWDTPTPAFRALVDFRETGSDPGAMRARRSSACRSTLSADDDFPVVVRFDSTETTQMGRGAPVVNAVAAFPGSAWDVTDPAAPRRLNLLLNESAGRPDTSWTPGLPVETLFVMASTYDGSGTTYTGLSIALQLSDCAYALRLEPNPGGQVPAGLHMRPASLDLLVAGPTPTPAGPGIRLWWSSEADAPQQVYRAPADRPWAEEPIATLAADARSFVDTSLPAEVLSVYRVVAGGAPGDPGPSSVRRTPRRGDASTGSHRITLRGIARAPLSWHVTGYAAPNGREYAVVGESELVVYDVTDPDPVEVGRLPIGGYRAAISGRHLYLIGPKYGDVPVRIIDLATPSAPVVVGEFWPHPEHPGRGARAVTVAAGRLYLSGDTFGTTIWSLSDPAGPAYLGALPREVPDYSMDLDLQVVDDRLYVARHRDGRVDIVDVSVPTHPSRIAGFSGTVPWKMCADARGEHLFVSEVKGGYVRTAVFDVRAPYHVVLVSELPSPDRFATDCGMRGDLLITTQTNGLRVWHVADPTAPTEVAFYNGAEVMGPLWAVATDLPSGRLLAHDLTGTLFVMEVDQSVAAEPGPSTAISFALAPNPTAGGTAVLVTLAAPAEVALTVHDVLGRRVAGLPPTAFGAGPHRLAVPVAGLPAGIYVVRMTVGGHDAGRQTLTIAR